MSCVEVEYSYENPKAHMLASNSAMKRQVKVRANNSKNVLGDFEVVAPERGVGISISLSIMELELLDRSRDPIRNSSKPLLLKDALHS